MRVVRCLPALALIFLFLVPACRAPERHFYALALPAGTVDASADGVGEPLLFRMLRLEREDGKRRVLFSEEGEAEEFAGRTLTMAFTAFDTFTSTGLFVRVWDEPAGPLELRLATEGGAEVARQSFDGLLNRTWVDLPIGPRPPGRYRLEARQTGGGRLGWFGHRFGPSTPLPEAPTAAGVPFRIGVVPQYVNGAIEVPIGARAQRIFFLGGLSSYDHGDGWWRDYEVQGDQAHRQMLGDQAGQVEVVYEDGARDRLPLVFGRNLWWYADFDGTASGGPYLEPFASGPEALADLRASLALADALPDPRARYVWALRPRPQRIRVLRLVDSGEKEGYPVIAAITIEGEAPAASAELRPGSPAPAVPNGLLAREVVPLVLGSEAAEGEGKSRLATLRRRLYASAAASGPVTPAAPPDGPTISFRGTADAEILTAAYADNLADLRAKVDADGGFHTSTPGAANYGGYQGIGTWRTDVGAFAGQVWARDLGRALLELQRFGLGELAEKPLAFAGAHLYDLPNAFPALSRGGERLPAHWTTVLGEPNYLDADGRGDGNQENDGHGLLLLAFAGQWEAHNRDLAWLRDRWAIIEDAAGWYVYQLAHPERSKARGVLYTESESANDRGYDVYSNAIAAEALARSATLADALGYVDVAERWRGAEAALRAAMVRQLTDASAEGVTWRATAWNWTYGNDSLGPAIIAADTRGYAPPLSAIDRATYVRQKQLTPDLAQPRVLGYGQAFLTQAALLNDDVDGYSRALGQLARALSGPGPAPFRVPEGVVRSFDGAYWYRSGDLGNAVHEAEVLKTLALIAGVDDHDPARMTLVPRPPTAWTEIAVRDYPTRAAGRVAFTYTREPAGFTARLTLEGAGAWRIRLGPAPTGTTLVATRDGRPETGRVEQAGAYQWLWVEGTGSATVGVRWN
jgi:hypothetical protein